MSWKRCYQFSLGYFFFPCRVSEFLFFEGRYWLWKIRRDLRDSILDTVARHSWDASAHLLCNFKPKWSQRQWERLHVSCKQAKNASVIHTRLHFALVIGAILQEHLGLPLIYFLHALCLSGSDAWLARSLRCTLQHQALWTPSLRGISNLIDKYFTGAHLLHSSPCILEWAAGDTQRKRRSSWRWWGSGTGSSPWCPQRPARWHSPWASCFPQELAGIQTSVTATLELVSHICSSVGAHKRNRLQQVW